MGHYTNLTVDVDLGDLAKTIAQEGENVARNFILNIDEEIGTSRFSERLVLDLIKVVKDDLGGCHDPLWERFVDNVRKEVAN
jgi:hypothetical protein